MDDPGFTVLPDRILFRGGSAGCARVLGVPTLLVNAAMAFAGVHAVGDGNAVGAALVVLGALGMALGLALLFGSYALTVDRHAVTQRWSALVPLRTRVTPLAGFHAVTLVRRLGRTRYGYYTSISVCLAGPRGELSVRSGFDEHALVAAAQALSALLGLPLRDARQDPAAMVAEHRARFAPAWRVLLVAAVVAVGLGAVAVGFAILQARATETSTPSRPGRHRSPQPWR